MSWGEESRAERETSQTPAIEALSSAPELIGEVESSASAGRPAARRLRCITALQGCYEWIVIDRSGWKVDFDWRWGSSAESSRRSVERSALKPDLCDGGVSGSARGCRHHDPSVRRVFRIFDSVDCVLVVFLESCVEEAQQQEAAADLLNSCID